MPISLNVINSKFSRPGEFGKTPLLGFSMDWLGQLVSFTLDSSGVHIGFDTPEPSKLKRLRALPRLSYEFDYAGKRVLFKNVPALETVANTTFSRFSLQRFLSVAQAQLLETRPPTTNLRGPR